MRAPSTVCAALGILLAGGTLLTGCGNSVHAKSTRAAEAPLHGGARLPGTGRPLAVIGDKNFTEQFVLGALYGEALSAQGYSVVVNRDIGPPEVIQQALASGRLSMYPEYVGTWNAQIAGVQGPQRTLRGALRVARRYAHSHGLALLSPTPFSDTPGLALAASYASRHRLRSLRDLWRVAATMTVGTPPQFAQSATGLPALERAYGFAPAKVTALEVGAQYAALQTGTVQAAEVNTTDAQLQDVRYRLLRDPRRVFGFGEVAPVVPLRVLAAEGPAFAHTIDRVSAVLTQPVIRALNAAVDLRGEDPRHVARAFLLAHGIPAAPTG